LRAGAAACSRDCATSDVANGVAASFTVCCRFGDKRRAKNLRCPTKVHLHRLINRAQTSVMLPQMSIDRSGARLSRNAVYGRILPCAALIFALHLRPGFVRALS